MCPIIFLSVHREGRGACKPARAELESMRAYPLVRVWAGVRPGTEVWGRRKFPCYEGRVLRQNLDDAQPTLPLWKRQSPASSQPNGPPKLLGAFGTPTAFQRRAVQGQGSAAARGEFG